MNAITIGDPSFPPSTGGDPVTFGLTLALMMMSSALALYMILNLIWSHMATPQPLRSPLTMFRMMLGSLYTTIFVGFAPDAIYLMSWGEVSPMTSIRISQIDRVFDGLTFAPLAASVLLFIYSYQTVAYQLIRQPLPVPLLAPWPLVRRPLAIVFMVCVISLGVAIAK